MDLRLRRVWLKSEHKQKSAGSAAGLFYLVNSSEGAGAEDLDPFELRLFKDAELRLVGRRSTGRQRFNELKNKWKRGDGGTTQKSLIWWTGTLQHSIHIKIHLKDMKVISQIWRKTFPSAVPLITSRTTTGPE